MHCASSPNSDIFFFCRRLCENKRLVGKDLHVLVEDALLTVEAIPIPESHEINDETGHDEGYSEVTKADGQNDTNGGGNRDDNQNHDGTSDTGGDSGSTSATAAATAAQPASSSSSTKKKPPPEPKRTTVGDRVMADNPIARAIASIPHLLLRDIRIRLIIRDEAPSTTNDGSGTTAEYNTHDHDTQGEPSEAPKEGGNPSYDPRSNDTMLEMGIEFLSITSGEDALSNFQEKQEDESLASDLLGEDGTSPKPPMASIPSFSSVDSTLDQNEYMVRHIRTGRGQNAGIWVQVYTPTAKLPRHLEERTSLNGLWARQRWNLATTFNLVRCSGLDVRARILLGTKKEVARISWFYSDDDDAGGATVGDNGSEEDDNEELDEYTLDSLFMGVDNVAPGPQLPLPPINEPTISRGATPVKSNHSTKDNSHSTDPPDTAGQPQIVFEQERVPTFHPGADIVYKDRNNIQSCMVPSFFHRVSRGMQLSSCTDCTHLPSAVSSLCWQSPSRNINTTSTLDDYTPMPGFAFQITLRDPLEINVDRTSLDAIGLVSSLFQNKEAKQPSTDKIDTDENRTATKAADEHEQEQQQDAEIQNTAPTATTDATTLSTTSSTTASYFAGYFSTKSSEPKRKQKQDDDESKQLDAFATYMQPESIQVIGIHLSEILLRVHVMKKKDDGILDTGLSFCYWEFGITCLTMDHQSFAPSPASLKKLTATTRTTTTTASTNTYTSSSPTDSRNVPSGAQDLRLDVAYLNWKEYQGTNQTTLVSLGIPYPANRVRSDSLASLATLIEESNKKEGKKNKTNHRNSNLAGTIVAKVPWPTTACALMDVPPPLETLIYRGRERHGIQLRYATVGAPVSQSTVDGGTQRSQVYMRLGTMSVSTDWGFWNHFDTIQKEAMQAVLKNKVSPEQSSSPSPSQSPSSSSADQPTKSPTTRDDDDSQRVVAGPGTSSESEKEVVNKKSKNQTPSSPKEREEVVEGEGKSNDNNGNISANDEEEDDENENKSNKKYEKKKNESKSLMTYRIRLDGGSVVMRPLLNVKMPLTQFAGEQSSGNGMFIETVLNKFQFSYGSKGPDASVSSSSSSLSSSGSDRIQKRGLSLQQLAALPETVRMRVLLCLSDYSSLEQALQIKKESNSFKRCRAVNKGILKNAKKLAKKKGLSLSTSTSKPAAASLAATRRNVSVSSATSASSSATTATIGSAATGSAQTPSASSSSSSTSRRQEIIGQMMQLNDTELDDLWSLHQRYRRKKLSKKKDINTGSRSGSNNDNNNNTTNTRSTSKRTSMTDNNNNTTTRKKKNFISITKK